MTGENRPPRRMARPLDAGERERLTAGPDDDGLDSAATGSIRGRPWAPRGGEAASGTIPGTVSGTDVQPPPWRDPAPTAPGQGIRSGSAGTVRHAWRRTAAQPALRAVPGGHAVGTPDDGSAPGFTDPTDGVVAGRDDPPVALATPPDADASLGVEGPFVDRRGAAGSRVRSRRRGGPRGCLRFLLIAVIVGAAVLAATWLFLGPAIASTIRDMAASNPSLMRMQPIADVVRGELGADLTSPAGTDPAVIRFEIPNGMTAGDVAKLLADKGLVKSPLVVEYLVITQNLTDQIQAGTYELKATMTPSEVLSKLQQAPIATVQVHLREGLRIEQIAAYLQTIDLQMDVKQFYDLAADPPDSVRSAYSFLASLPKGRSLEGFLGSGNFEVYQDITPDEMVRQLLDLWGQENAQAVSKAQSAGKDLYQVVTVASLVEQEAKLDSERSLIAGVYTNRIKDGMMLQADPTVEYAWDSAQLRKAQFDTWPNYYFWSLQTIKVPLDQVKVPSDLQGYQSYQETGLIPGPICSPRLSSLLAAITPNTKAGYLYFVAKNDGSNGHAFAKTYDQHVANLRKYGYIQ